MRLIQQNKDHKFKKVKNLPSLKFQRLYASLCSMKDRYAFLSGGYCHKYAPEANTLKMVERFDIKKNVWEDMPSLRVPRK